MKDKILITGGAGYIGSKLIDIFPNKKKLIIIDSFYYGKQFLKKNKIKCHSENINNKINDKIFKKVKTVVHLAVGGGRVISAVIDVTGEENKWICSSYEESSTSSLSYGEIDSDRSGSYDWEERGAEEGDEDPIDSLGGWLNEF